MQAAAILSIYPVSAALKVDSLLARIFLEEAVITADGPSNQNFKKS